MYRNGASVSQFGDKKVVSAMCAFALIKKIIIYLLKGKVYRAGSVQHGGWASKKGTFLRSTKVEARLVALHLLIK